MALPAYCTQCTLARLSAEPDDMRDMQLNAANIGRFALPRALSEFVRPSRNLRSL